MTVFAYHTGCRYEGCWLVSLHTTREGAVQAAISAMEADDANFAEDLDPNLHAKWAPTEGQANHWNQQWPGGIIPGSQIAFIQEHEVEESAAAESKESTEHPDVNNESSYLRQTPQTKITGEESADG